MLKVILDNSLTVLMFTGAGAGAGRLRNPGHNLILYSLCMLLKPYPLFLMYVVKTLSSIPYVCC